MSLTREEWLVMWDDIKHIEENVKQDYNKGPDTVRDSINEIKKKIQSVIGQME